MMKQKTYSFESDFYPDTDFQNVEFGKAEARVCTGGNVQVLNGTFSTNLVETEKWNDKEFQIQLFTANYFDKEVSVEKGVGFEISLKQVNTLREIALDIQENEESATEKDITEQTKFVGSTDQRTYFYGTPNWKILDEETVRITLDVEKIEKGDFRSSDAWNRLEWYMPVGSLSQLVKFLEEILDAGEER